ncbi:MAG TPA: UDP-N-acetylglucosamine 1-carboxyvinyltransferase [Bacillota bacterium]|nr:UDP-N-acetylglucosamine 1-carboxyvinyltransferase [Bacillota bacterium]HOK68476.1 UDP-N-acetylglucosamine 1-carboxyvinyltransferase [Bacillota bacterium]HPP85104.1 UDP-N-acetylglucosamine 1-carboxyvinyltransferase [Bacillota bacterium]
MERIYINGGKPLSGTIEVAGMKNAALPILFATIIVEDKCVIENLPKIKDIETALEILKAMGAKIRELSNGNVEIDTREVVCGSIPIELAKAMRGSYYVLGAELARFGRAQAAFPGGCDFGERPMDQHIKGFEALGAKVIDNGDFIKCTTESGLNAASIYLDVPSVGATINIMLASVKLDGLTVIENAAREPHVVDLANFLNSCGADISGAGTEVIKIRGVKQLHGVTYAIIPDMIEAGTYMVAAAATNSTLTITNVIPKHMESITAKLIDMGISVTELDDALIVSRNNTPLKKIKVKTNFYPGFPTDMQPQMCVLLCLADGQSTLMEGVFDNRFKYTDELIRMGACITVQGRTATIEGRPSLHPATVRAVDLRGGAALVIAGLATKGVTWIDDIHHIERGYVNMVEKLQSVGADIKKVVIPDVPNGNHL